MEPLRPCASDHSRSHLSSKGDEEKTPKVTGDGDNCVSSDWTKETPEQEDSEEDEYEKVTRAIWTHLVQCWVGLGGFLAVVRSGVTCRNEASVRFSCGE